MAERLTLYKAPIEVARELTVVVRRGDHMAEMLARGYTSTLNGHVPAEIAPTGKGQFVTFADLATDPYGRGPYYATRDKGPINVQAVILDDDEIFNGTDGSNPDSYVVALSSGKIKGAFTQVTDAPNWAPEAHATYVVNGEPDKDNYGRIRRTAADRLPSSFAKQVVGEMDKRQAEVLTPGWLKKFGRNPFGREVPTKQGGTITFPAGSMEFFITPNDETRTRLNEVLSTERPTIFIPTCVPDEYVHTGGASIEYTGAPLTGKIAWTAQNTLDALRILLPELAKRGIKPNLVMGMGDYEYYMGANRGMTEDAYRQAVNASADKVAATVAQIIAEAYGQKPQVDTTLNLKGGMNTVRVLGDPNLPTVTVTGMMELAGGKDTWLSRVAHAQDRVREAATAPQFAGLTQRVMENRRPMTNYWLRMDGNWNPSAEDYLNKFVDDAAAYVAFDEVARERYGSTMMVLAGDSRPMELFGSQLTDVPLLSLSGLYAGAEFNE